MGLIKKIALITVIPALMVVTESEVSQAEGYLSFNSYDSVSGDPLLTNLSIWGPGIPDTIYATTSANGYYLKKLPAADDYEINVYREPAYYPLTTSFNISYNETTFIEAFLEPAVPVVFTIYVENPETSNYRFFYANGTWDIYGRYTEEITNAGFVLLNDIGEFPDLTAGDGYFSGWRYIAMNVEHSYGWGAYSESYNHSGSFLQSGNDFNLTDPSPYSVDTLYLNPSGYDPEWGISVYTPEYGEFDLNLMGTKWSRWLPFNEGESYPFIYRAMHSDFSNYGDGGVGGDTIIFVAPEQRYYQLIFNDITDGYKISVAALDPWFDSYPDDTVRFIIEEDSTAGDLIRLYNFGGGVLSYIGTLFIDSLGYNINGSFSNPDGFGYVWTDSDNSGDVEYYWVDIEQNGTRVEGLEDDDYAGPFNIGFPFYYYGEYYDSFYISSNGYISLGVPSSDPNNRYLPSVNAPSNIIAPYWDDYRITQGGEIYYKSSTDSLIVSFIDLVRNDGNYPYIFQVLLTPDNIITFQFDALIPPRTRATTGMQNADAFYGTTVGFNSLYVHSAMAVKLLPSWLTMERYSGSIVPGRFKYIPLTVRGNKLPIGVYDARLRIVSTDPDTTRGIVTIPIRMEYIMTGIENDSETAQLPRSAQLFPNYPNPFNPSTNISYFLPAASSVKLEIYNILGRKVAVLTDGENKSAGKHTIQWNGIMQNGRAAASGIYFYSLKLGESRITRKMLLIK